MVGAGVVGAGVVGEEVVGAGVVGAGVVGAGVVGAAVVGAGVGHVASATCSKPRRREGSLRPSVGRGSPHNPPCDAKGGEGWPKTAAHY